MEDHIFRYPPSGVIPALITPFRKCQTTSPDTDGTYHVDIPAIIQLCEHLISHGISAWILNGTTGESPTLSVEEVVTIVEEVRKLFPVVYLIVGCGTNCTASTVSRARQFIEAGADALLVVTPYFNRPSQRMLVSHYQTVAQSVSRIPVILYDVPSRTGTHLEVETVNEVANSCPNVVALKTSRDMDACAELRKLGPKHPFKYYSGEDQLWTRAVAYHQFDGVMSVVAQALPEPFLEAYYALQCGESSGVLEMYESTVGGLLKTVYCDTNPVGIKAILALMFGFSDSMRKPLLPATKEYSQDIESALNSYRSNRLK